MTTTKEKRKGITPIFTNTFESASLYLASSFLKSASFKHALTRGTERERPLREFLSQNLPGRFSVVTGEVIDREDHHSNQLDLMIFDSQQNFALYDGASTIIPSEAFLVGIEVKTKLNKTEIKRALKAASSLRKLKAEDHKFASHRERGELPDGKYRYYNCLFAYGTDIAKKDWLNKEYKRLVKISTELGLPDPMFDRIYVAHRGLICPFDNMGLVEKPNSSVAFMTFYINMLNFLLRQNIRRKQAPYDRYTLRPKEGWYSLDESKPL